MAVSLLPAHELVPKPLVTAFLKIVTRVLRDRPVERLRPHEDHPVEALALDRLHERFGIGFHVRRLVACHDNLDAGFLQHRLEGGGEERVATATAPWWVFADFPPESSPRLMSVSFGIEYEYADYDIVLVDFFHCADFEVRTSEWPLPGAGTTISWVAPQTSRFTEIYWFVGYNYYGEDTEFSLVTHPTQGGYFADDTGALDPIAGYGRLGFFAEPGYLPCATGEGVVSRTAPASSPPTSPAKTREGAGWGTAPTANPTPATPPGPAASRMRAAGSSSRTSASHRAAATVAMEPIATRTRVPRPVSRSRSRDAATDAFPLPRRTPLQQIRGRVKRRVPRSGMLQRSNPRFRTTARARRRIRAIRFFPDRTRTVCSSFMAIPLSSTARTPTSAARPL